MGAEAVAEPAFNDGMRLSNWASGQDAKKSCRLNFCSDGRLFDEPVMPGRSFPSTPIEDSSRLATVGKQAHVNVLLALLNQDSIRTSKHLAVGEEF